MEIVRTGLVLRPNNARVLFRPFAPRSQERRLKIVARIMALNEDEVDARLEAVMTEFRGRHHKHMQFFLDRFEQVSEYLLTDQRPSENRRLLIGAYFTQEYSLESAALFNPSMIWHPDQTGVPEGSRRFILGLRATGEGHISSLTFRSGFVDADGEISVDRPTGFVTAPRVLPTAKYERRIFERKLGEMGMLGNLAAQVFPLLGEYFTLAEMESHIKTVLRENGANRHEFQKGAEEILALAKANYEIEFLEDQELSERVVFPYSPTELNGIEDARFVEFREDDGSIVYYATYSAFDGTIVLPQLLETTDFLHFKMSTLNGPGVGDKGFALFPRKINGHYAMLSRQDGENIYLMYSDMINFWHTKQLIVKPTFPWEFVQVGNCGSPLETPAGWLVLSHGVGPMRKYSIGAFLLDLDDPARVIARLSEPLMTPNENEREGYVPNVVYSCGAALFGEMLVIPYAMSDYASTFATVKLGELLDAMETA